jgi:hypothetical protein
MLYLQHLVTMTANKVEAQADIRQVKAIAAVTSASWNAAALRREQLNSQNIETEQHP